LLALIIQIGFDWCCWVRSSCWFGLVQFNHLQNWFHLSLFGHLLLIVDSGFGVTNLAEIAKGSVPHQLSLRKWQKK